MSTPGTPEREALAAEAIKLSKILTGMVEGGYSDLATLYTDEQADGDAFVQRAAEVLRDLAASPAAGGVQALPMPGSPEAPNN